MQGDEFWTLLAAACGMRFALNWSLSVRGGASSPNPRSHRLEGRAKALPSFFCHDFGPGKKPSESAIQLGPVSARFAFVSPPWIPSGSSVCRADTGGVLRNLPTDFCDAIYRSCRWMGTKCEGWKVVGREMDRKEGG